MRTSRLFFLGAVLALALGWFLTGAGRSSRADQADAPAVNATAEQLRSIQTKLDDIKHSVAEVRAENNDLKVRLREMMHAMEHLANGGKAVKPEKPRVESVPDALPELKPLPEK